jgi:hypothetical protein
MKIRDIERDKSKDFLAILQDIAIPADKIVEGLSRERH